MYSDIYVCILHCLHLHTLSCSWRWGCVCESQWHTLPCLRWAAGGGCCTLRAESLAMSCSSAAQHSVSCSALWRGRMGHWEIREQTQSAMKQIFIFIKVWLESMFRELKALRSLDAECFRFSSGVWGSFKPWFDDLLHVEAILRCKSTTRLFKCPWSNAGRGCMHALHTHTCTLGVYVTFLTPLWLSCDIKVCVPFSGRMTVNNAQVCSPASVNAPVCVWMHYMYKPHEGQTVCLCRTTCYFDTKM